jgi:transketolase
MNYERALEDLISSDENIIILTAENRASIRNLPEKIKNRFIDVGIAEQTMIGVSAGLALRGRIPVVHALSAFLTMRAFEFIRTDIGISKLPVKLVGFVPGFLSEANGPTHQAIEDISLMRGIPGMNIFCPSDEDDLLIGLEKVIKSPEPFYIRYNSLQTNIKHNKEFEIGEAELIADGEDITILTYGMMLQECYEASLVLESKGISVRLLNLRTLKPIAEEIIISSAMETKALITVEDHFLTGGLYSIIAELFVKNNISVPVYPIALNNKWFKPVLLNDVIHYEGFDRDSLVNKIFEFYDLKLEVINFKSLI